MTPQQRYRAKHPDRCRASRRASYAKNPSTELASSELWRQKNLAKVNKTRRELYAENIYQERAYAAATHLHQHYGHKGVKPVTPAAAEKLGLEGKKLAAIAAHKPQGELKASY